MMSNPNPLFEGSSSELPTILSISFASDPGASLGVQLTNHDNGLTNEMFLPGYASVAKLWSTKSILRSIPIKPRQLDGDTLARRSGVKIGDFIVAVNGEGFRRFPPDFEDTDLEDVTEGLDLINLTEGAEANIRGEDYENQRKLKGRVVSCKKSGEAYDKLLGKIREVKSSMIPLHISMERYMWDSRVHSWSRFLSARNGIVPQAMTMIQAHERWRNEFFPIDLTEPILQKILKAHAVSEIDVAVADEEDIAATVYIDFAKLQNLRSMDDSEALSIEVVKAFVLYTETLLSKAPDPRRPKTCQFVDLTGVSIKQGFNVNILKKLYATFEPNYPETLEKMVMYPVPRVMASAVNVMLNFVNENTRKKFVITDDLLVVCKELGWNIKEIEICGSINGYMKKHLKHGLSFLFE